ncbi:MAG TPA: MXAN_2561 family MXYO-CTERM-anchored protein, partial [Myxococcaceae bacterium]|nr:MXAN_2561 family MXYO-CTERM-anchored protein [Myxococcaceae bacterium]
LQIFVTASTTCPDAPSATSSPPDVVVQTVQSGDLANGTTTGTFSFAFNTMPGFVSGACGTDVDFTNYLCASVTSRGGTGSCDGTLTKASAIALRYDNLPPPPPAVSVTSLDSKLSVGLAATGTGTDLTDVQFFNVQFAVAPSDGGAPNWLAADGDISASTPSVTINNLVNDTTYLVRGYSKDEAGNLSGPSDPVSGMPEQTFGFWANYIDDGGQDTGGCTAAGGASSGAALAALALLALAWRRG